nr:phosphate/phosphite/phosphonate ABC transporter substrate-binding protein [Fructilactobacillus florum]
MMQKKWWKVGLLGSALVCLAVGMAACGKSNQSTTANYKPKKLTVEFNPSSNAGKMEAQAKPMQKMLEKQLHVPVKVTVATSGNAMVEALGSKTADIAFLTPTSYVLGHKNYGIKALLQATRYKYAAGNDENLTETPSDHYYGEIVVKKGGKVKKLSDLKGKKIATQDTTSTAGYVFPAAELSQQGININQDGIKTFTVKGSDQGVLAVYNGNADAAFVFQGARKIAAKDDPKVMTDTTVLYMTKPIPNDTISVRNDMDPAWNRKITTAFENIAKTKKGHDLIYQIYGHQGYVAAKDSNFDPVRKNLKIVNQLSK